MTNFDDRWGNVVEKVSNHFKVTADYNFMLFVIGLQDLGSGLTRYSREEKLDIINLGKCRLLANHGYLCQTGADDKGWPSFKVVKPTGNIAPEALDEMLKSFTILYFEEQFS